MSDKATNLGDRKLRGLYSPFKDNGSNISAEQQAAKIITEIQRRLDAGSRGVAITYSANNHQAEAFYAGYTQENDAAIAVAMSGAGNQGAVFEHVYAGIIKNRWQNKVHILPIATSMRGGLDYDKDNSPTDLSNMVTKKTVDRDMQNIAQHIGAGWDVLGIQTQQSQVDTFSIGGGYSKGWYNHDAGQGRYAADLMAKMANGDFSTLALAKSYKTGEAKGVGQVAADPSITLPASELESPKHKPKLEQPDSDTSPATIPYKELPAKPMLMSFTRAMAKNTQKLKNESDVAPVIEGDSIKPEFMGRITQAVEGYIQQAQSEYKQIKFKPAAAGEDKSLVPEPIEFASADELQPGVLKDGEPAAKDKYCTNADQEANTEAEHAAVYKAILYHDAKLNKITDKGTDGKETDCGYSLSKDNKKILEARIQVVDNSPKVSVRVHDRGPDSIHLALHTVYLHAQQAGMKQPKINIQDVASPNYAFEMFKAADAMGFKVKIKPETLEKLTPEQKTEYDSTIKAKEEEIARASKVANYDTTIANDANVVKHDNQDTEPAPPDTTLKPKSKL